MAALIFPAPAAAHPTEKHHPKSCSAFVKKVWDPDRWERGQPKQSTLEAFHSSSCRKAFWRRAQKRFYEHRREELWRARVTPFYGGGQWWAIPFYVVVCESSVRGYITSGYYGILLSTWAYWAPSGFASTPGEAAKWEEDVVAHELWVAYGGEPWECF